MNSCRITLEVAVTTVDEAVRAVEAGADRLELGAALEVGGVAPSPGTFLVLRDALPHTPVCVLLRPRSGGFTHSERESASVKRDAEWFLGHGAAAIVFGILTADGTIDRIRCAELVRLAEGRAVFHRAFDFLADQLGGLAQLIDLGFARVLTSGAAATAHAGRARIAALMSAACGRIEVLPAAGITAEHVAELLLHTGCEQVHASLRSPVPNPTLTANPAIAAHMGGSSSTDAARVSSLRRCLDSSTFQGRLSGLSPFAG